MNQIDRHREAAPCQNDHIVFLGDLIDRGPDSKGVIEFAKALCETRDNVHFIKGNHEEALVRGLQGEPDHLTTWLQHGGYDTAESYGLDRGHLIGQSLDTLEHTLMSAIPGIHVEFLSSFLDSVTFGDFLMVHAGIRPGTPIDQQSEQDMRWIRQAFLDSDEDHGCVVVHGHTISDTVVHKHNRIGLDTGAYKTGLLSAAWIRGTEVGFIQSSAANV